MTRTLFALLCTVTMLGLVGSASAQQAESALVRVLLPQEDAKVYFDETLTKQKGTDRSYSTPPLAAGKTFTYTVTAKWWPNNYTEVIRTRTLTVQAGKQIELDLRKPDPKDPDKFLIRFVPTPEEVVEAMCKLGKVGKDDVVYDLGCGDGRIVITAVTDFKAKRGVGVDIDGDLVERSQKNAKEAKVDDRVAFRKQDVLTIKDLADADVVMLYMGEDVNLRLMPILKSTLKPGARIVSHDFKMGDWKAEKTETIYDEFGDEHIIYLWTIGERKQ
jgi:uncharacterized protein (TIGR03000 family)